jgi:hypothetical protein
MHDMRSDAFLRVYQAENGWSKRLHFIFRSILYYNKDLTFVAVEVLRF